MRQRKRGAEIDEHTDKGVTDSERVREGKRKRLSQMERGAERQMDIQTEG